MNKQAIAETLSPVRPFDEYNQTLLENVHPPEWANPTPDGRYNLVVVGAGTAGLVTAAGAAGLGAKVALIERSLMGGDCLNIGCVPSKALLRCARAFADVRDSGEFGIHVPGDIEVDFPAIMERMRRLRAKISPADSASRFRDLGVDVFLGDAQFTGRDSIEVNGVTLNFKKACIATGAKAVEPPIPGLNDAGFLTNETLYSITELPERFAVLGAGPIGCEMAQAFARFGSEVHLIEHANQILTKEDRDAATIVEKSMKRDGVYFHLGCKLTEVKSSPNEKSLQIEHNNSNDEIVVDDLLIGVGRAPNVQGLGLDKAGVAFDEKQGVAVNDRLRTTNSDIFAAGDVCSKYKFTHAADFMARTVIGNALFFGRSKVSSLIIPWCTYTDPEIAHVGMYPQEAEEQGNSIDTYNVDLSDVDRAILESDDEGLLKVHTRKGKDTIVGATLVARHAGDMISEITLAMNEGVGLGGISKTIHPYPTVADAIRAAGDQYNKTRLTPFVKSMFERFLSWRR